MMPVVMIPFTMAAIVVIVIVAVVLIVTVSMLLGDGDCGRERE
jgi:hypothetical protein